MPPYDESHPASERVGGHLVPDRRVTEMLAYTGVVDAAATLYEERGNKQLLRRTATDDRINQLWESVPLRDTIIAYALLLPSDWASVDISGPVTACRHASRAERTCRLSLRHPATTTPCPTILGLLN
ncbi:hypothetical protein OG345_40515 (plasmid) [Streptomyces sp. NBC_01220]|uniref:Tn3 transposase DDE domain-containing protein n=1 Tax=Streptomyces poriferorum TaxID=2798799 RepID=A0ABY9J0W1_9ACTN|nr:MULTISPECIES: hypothetical protein [unclassified Streptomyces]MDP5309336.1 hypothetical protein [Streptomyces sp. Alt4]WLQ61458.1 hypothetical protein P8A19_41370 [Streptomyces sp. Alt2]WSQ49300.1 hypothetical protein OG345_40515 [Streptomyces sp. NBC_01220]